MPIPKNQPLTQKEKLFCWMLSESGNVREAAARAGYSLFPYKKGLQLLGQERVRRYLQEWEEKKQGCKSAELARKGLERLAFGSVQDAVRLLLEDGTSPDELEQMDLFQIAEIKRPKEGALEIKFFNRLEALSLLLSQADTGTAASVPFFEALEQGALALRSAPEEQGE